MGVQLDVEGREVPATTVGSPALPQQKTRPAKPDLITVLSAPVPGQTGFDDTTLGLDDALFPLHALQGDRA